MPGQESVDYSEWQAREERIPEEEGKITEDEKRDKTDTKGKEQRSQGG